LLYLEGGCGFAAVALWLCPRWLQDLSQVTALAAGQGEDLSAVFGVGAGGVVLQQSIPFPQLCCCLSFWELMAIWSSRQELIWLRTSVRTNPGEWRLPHRLSSVTVQPGQHEEGCRSVWLGWVEL